MKLKQLDFFFVLMQFFLFLGYILEIELLMYKSYQLVSVIGIVITIIGVLVSITALLQLNKNLFPFPTPKEGTSLIKNGLYKYVRHPIYTGILATLLGYSIYSGSGYKFIIFLLLYILFFYKSIYEEKQLSIVFKEYVKYKTDTGRFSPKRSSL